MLLYVFRIYYITNNNNLQHQILFFLAHTLQIPVVCKQLLDKINIYQDQYTQNAHLGYLY
nr:MAG TPA: hypothetical protein [Caudoviricetes sp.]